MKEDGNLDILVEYVNKADRTPFIDFIKCDDKGDTTFLKVQVFSNVCVDDCPLQSPSDRGVFFVCLLFGCLNDLFLFCRQRNCLDGRMRLLLNVDVVRCAARLNAMPTAANLLSHISLAVRLVRPRSLAEFRRRGGRWQSALSSRLAESASRPQADRAKLARHNRAAGTRRNALAKSTLLDAESPHHSEFARSNLRLRHPLHPRHRSTLTREARRSPRAPIAVVQISF